MWIAEVYCEFVILNIYQHFFVGGGIAATFCGAFDSRCSFIINDNLVTGSCTEWYVSALHCISSMKLLSYIRWNCEGSLWILYMPLLLVVQVQSTLLLQLNYRGAQTLDEKFPSGGMSMRDMHECDWLRGRYGVYNIFNKHQLYVLNCSSSWNCDEWWAGGNQFSQHTRRCLHITFWKWFLHTTLVSSVLTSPYALPTGVAHYHYIHQQCLDKGWCWSYLGRSQRSVHGAAAPEACV